MKVEEALQGFLSKRKIKRYSDWTWMVGADECGGELWKKKHTIGGVGPAGPLQDNVSAQFPVLLYEGKDETEDFCGRASFPARVGRTSG